MDGQQMNETDAQAALAAMGDARRELAQVATCPPRRHAVFGLMTAMLVLAQGVPVAVKPPLLVGAMVLMVIALWSDRRRTGVFVNGYRKGSTRPISFGALVIGFALMAVEIRLRSIGAPAWQIGAVSVIALGAGTALSVLWSRVFKREMEQAA